MPGARRAQGPADDIGAIEHHPRTVQRLDEAAAIGVAAVAQTQLPRPAGLQRARVGDPAAARVNHQLHALVGIDQAAVGERHLVPPELTGAVDRVVAVGQPVVATGAVYPVLGVVRQHHAAATTPHRVADDHQVGDVAYRIHVQRPGVVVAAAAFQPQGGVVAHPDLAAHRVVDRAAQLADPAGAAHHPARAVAQRPAGHGAARQPQLRSTVEAHAAAVQGRVDHLDVGIRRTHRPGGQPLEVVVAAALQAQRPAAHGRKQAGVDHRQPGRRVDDERGRLVGLHRAAVHQPGAVQPELTRAPDHVVLVGQRVRTAAAVHPVLLVVAHVHRPAAVQGHIPRQHQVGGVAARLQVDLALVGDMAGQVQGPAVLHVHRPLVHQPRTVQRRAAGHINVPGARRAQGPADDIGAV